MWSERICCRFRSPRPLIFHHVWCCCSRWSCFCFRWTRKTACSIYLREIRSPHVSSENSGLFAGRNLYRMTHKIVTPVLIDQLQKINCILKTCNYWLACYKLIGLIMWLNIPSSTDGPILNILCCFKIWWNTVFILVCSTLYVQGLTFWWLA